MKNKQNPNNQAFAFRLRQAMKDAGFQTSATRLAHAFNLRYWGTGITPHAARNWMFGISIPKQDKLIILCDMLHINPQDLLFGQTKANIGFKDIDGRPLALGDVEMIRQYMQLQPEHKHMIRQCVKMSLSFQMQQQSQSSLDRTDKDAA